MTESEFDELARRTGLSASNKEAARLVFVEQRQQIAAASEVGISKQRMNQIVKVIREAEVKKAEEDALALLKQGRGIGGAAESVAAVEASYAVAVKSARDQFGDDTRIHVPKADDRTVGTVIARSDFHLVQSVGRGSVVVHDLAKLDRVPALGKSVSIAYSGGKGTVTDRGREQSRGGAVR